MANFDQDTGDEEEVLACEETDGKFNAKKALMGGTTQENRKWQEQGGFETSGWQ